MSNTFIKTIGLKNINDFDLKNKRKIFFVNEININKIMQELGFDNFKYNYKENTKNFFMNFHLDGIQTFKKGKNQFDFVEKEPLWKYTLIIYDSDYKKDFTGGVFEFCDGQKIYPKKGMCVLFDSRDVHCVHCVTSGIRKNFLVKIY
jgi:hypothetical protein